MAKFKVTTRFLFTGTFEVEADNKDQAREHIEQHTGLVLGGNIHTTLPTEEIDWDFSTHPVKAILKIEKQH